MREQEVWNNSGSFWDSNFDKSIVIEEYGLHQLY